MHVQESEYLLLIFYWITSYPTQLHMIELKQEYWRINGHSTTKITSTLLKEFGLFLLRTYIPYWKESKEGIKLKYYSLFL